MEYPSIALVFAAGLLSFLSPCVLPLVPSYLGILGGAGRALFVTTVFFILGFTAVFIGLSIAVSAAFFLSGNAAGYIRIASGIVVIVLGFNVLFDFLSLLNYEKRFHTRRPRGLGGAFAAGAAFGAGWTPCIGPVLAGVLFLTGQSGRTAQAALFLGVYALGLGVPFLLAAAFFDRFLVTAAWFRARLPLIQKVSGCLLILMGLLILTGRFSALNTALQQWQYRYIAWAADKAPPFRFLADWLAWLQGL
jgi:cytochrome c-type biogenesis protein